MSAPALAPADNSTNPPGPTGDRAMGSAGPTGPPVQPGGPTNLTVLLIEDDPAGSLNVPELLDSAGKPIRVRTARNLTEAQRLLTDDVNCILLDLALPAPARPTDTDTEAADGPDDELAVLKHVLEMAPATPYWPSPTPATPNAARRPYGSAHRTTSSGTKWTAVS